MKIILWWLLLNVSSTHYNYPRCPFQIYSSIAPIYIIPRSWNIIIYNVSYIKLLDGTQPVTTIPYPIFSVLHKCNQQKTKKSNKSKKNHAILVIYARIQTHFGFFSTYKVFEIWFNLSEVLLKFNSTQFSKVSKVIEFDSAHQG